MRRTPRNENQESVSSFFQARDGRIPDEVMHGFLDEVKDLEVAWFTGEYHEVSDHFGDTLVQLLVAASSININAQDALNAAMVRRRKEGQ